MDLWIVGQWKSGELHEVVWEFQGVFDSEDRAIAACRDWTYFVGHGVLNQELPHESFVDSDWYYPLASQQEAS